MAALTKDELRHLRAGHVALWTWLAETGCESKASWPGWKWNGGEYEDRDENRCLACCATISTRMAYHDCRKCPIDWGFKAKSRDSTPCFSEIGAAFRGWVLAGNDTAECKRLAAKIATMWPEVE